MKEAGGGGGRLESGELVELSLRRAAGATSRLATRSRVREARRSSAPARLLVDLVAGGAPLVVELALGAILA